MKEIDFSKKHGIKVQKLHDDVENSPQSTEEKMKRKPQNDGKRKKKGFSRDVFYIVVIIDTPGAIDIVVPHTLQVGRHIARAWAWNEQVTSELEI